MRNFSWISICFFTISCSLIGQTNRYTKHKVSSGETITSIAQKYKVTPFDIFQINPDAQQGIAVNSILLIPGSSTFDKAKSLSNLTHNVQTKETWYSISKLYGISIAELEKANPEASVVGLKIGQELQIPNQIKPIQTKNEAIHLVQPKETKYSIGVKYGLTVEDINRLNPEIGESLQIGYSLVIKKNNFTKLSDLNQTSSPKKEQVQDTTIQSIKKELKFFPKSDSLKNQKKQLALLLPFNIDKIETDTINSLVSKLKKDKLLNLTLDFYAGALMAIDSAKTLGIDVEVSILDSQETKNTSAIKELIATYDLKSKDAIIGPFYQENAENAAELLSEFNVPVISPLSKDSTKQVINLYQSMPSANLVRKAVFEYMYEKQGAICAIIDPKKESTKAYLKENHTSVKIVELAPNGTFALENLLKVLVKNKHNFVIMDTQKTQSILQITREMISLLPEYQIQLVILEQNPTLDFDEIKLESLIKLKMLFPSITKENVTDEAFQFENEFKKNNNVFPSQFATRGFDITFDTLLRLAQETTFEESINKFKSEQIENKFDYITSEKGHQNNGVYVVYYDSDMFIKVAQ